MSDSSKKPNLGGRPKGKPNKRSWNLRRELEAAGFEPVKEMLVLFASTLDADQKWERLQWMFKHLYPTLAEVAEVPDVPEAEDDHISDRSTEDLLALVEKT